MRAFRIVILVMIAACLTLGLAGTASAQGAQARLIGRAILPAGILADGPKAGLTLAGGKSTTINGLKLPFDSQPVGSIAGIVPGSNPGTWLVLSDGRFRSAQDSDDYLLRIYVIEMDLRRASSGTGRVNPVDWYTLSDPAKKLTKPIKNASTRERNLTGADFFPQALSRARDGSFWVAEESTPNAPTLMHFDNAGKLLEAPVALGGAGAFQGMSMTPDGATLIIAQRSTSDNASVVFRSLALADKAIAPLTSYTLDKPTNTIAALAVISNTQAVYIENDGLAHDKAQFKRIFLAELRANPGRKTQIADLLNIADQSNISTASVFKAPQNAFGLGGTFRFPYADIGALYPADPQTLIVVNNNHVPFGLGRSTTEADDTEYIAIQLPQALALDSGLARPLR